MDKLTELNFLQIAMNHYDNPQCTSLSEFEEDLKRFTYLKSLLQRYIRNNEDLRERLILNHLIVLYNLFGDVTTAFLFYKIDKDCWTVLITFLVYLERMPDIITEPYIKLSDVVLDKTIIESLRNI